MADSDPFSRHYHVLTGPERLSLVMQAMARKDRVELRRLVDSCPIVQLRAGEPTYNARYDALYDLACVVALDIRGFAGKVNVLRSLPHTLEPILELNPAVAEAAFVQGWWYAKGQDNNGIVAELCADETPMSRIEELSAWLEKPPTSDAAEGRADQGSGSDSVEDTSETNAAWIRKLDEVADGARRQNDRLLAILDLTAAIAARQAAEPLEAFDRFCRREVGVEAITVFRAWGLPFDEHFVALLREYPEPAPREDKIVAYEAAITARWDRRVKN